MRYFAKAIPSRQLVTPRGFPAPFEAIDDRQPGYLATEDAYLISELRSAILGKRGGITEVAELDYAEFVKKKLALQSLPQQQARGLSGLLQAQSLRRDRAAGAAVAAAVANSPAPHIEKPARVEIPTQFPKLGRWREPTTA